LRFITGTATVFNETGADQDFRVESNGNENALFVDAGNDAIGMGATSSPVNAAATEGLFYSIGGSLTVASNTETLQINRNGTGGNNRANIGLYNNGTLRGTIGTLGGQDGIYFQSGGNVDNLQMQDGANIFNESSADIDFRVESDSNANQLFVDAGNSLTYVGSNTTTTTPSANGFGVKAGGEKTVVLESTAADTLLLFRDSGTTVPPYIGSFGNKLAISGYGGGTPDVGIGITTPQSAFHINDNGGPEATGNMTSGLIVSNGSAGTAIQMGTNDASGFGYIKSSYVNSSQTGRALLLYTGTTKAVSLETGETVINDDSLDRDFRVESDGNSHMLFVDAGLNQIGIADPPVSSAYSTAPLVVQARTKYVDNTMYALQLNSYTYSDTDEYTTMLGFAVEDSGWSKAAIGYTRTGGYDTGYLAFYNVDGGAQDNAELADEALRITGATVVVNERSRSTLDFRVESDSNANMLFVDAGNDAVGIGTNVAGNSTLEVRSTGVDGTFVNAIGFQYSGNSNEANTISTTVSSNASLSGMKFNISDGGGSSGKTNVATFLRNQIIFNDDSNDQDFRVESDNYSHALFVQASNGRVSMGDATAPNAQLHISTNANTTEPMGVNDSGANGATPKHRISFKYQTTEVGSIKANNSSTTFNTSSDARLKENIANAQDAGELIDAIQVRQFDWIIDGEHQRYGMVAQELNTVAPEAVSEGETEEDMMGVDYSKLVPMLIKEIQSLRARVADLES